MQRVRVQGDSMEPALSDGDILVIEDVPVSLGDIVVARHPFRTGVLLVKRVTAIDGDRYELRGDNPAASTDSRSLGWFRRDRILGGMVALEPRSEG